MTTQATKPKIRLGRSRRLFVVEEQEGGKPTGRHFFWFKCPACKEHHAFETPRWDFDGNYEKPTFSPRLVASSTCVVFCQSGILTYAATSSHHMVGKCVPLPPIGM